MIIKIKIIIMIIIIKIIIIKITRNSELFITNSAPA